MITRLARLLSNHLLLASTFAFALGIPLALAATSLGWAPGPLFLMLPLIFGLSALYAHRSRRPRAALLLLLPFLLSTGFVHGLLAMRAPTDSSHIFHLIKGDQEVVLICTLEQLPGFNGKYSTLLVDVHSLRTKDDARFVTARGLVQLKLKDPWPRDLMPGDQLAVRARLSHPTTYGNPGGFDYPAYLARQDIWITGWIGSPLYIQKIENEPTLLHRLRFLPEGLRTRISAFIDQRVDPEISSVYKALLIGEATGISEEILEAFKGSGTMHILSISGAHLSILAAFLFFCLYWLLRRSEKLILRYPVKKIAAALCLPPLVIYSLLAGAGTPVIRSLIMVFVFMIALCADKQKSLFIPLALAALMILVWEPASLFTASFQLSFMAVASMAMVAPLLAAITRTETTAEGKTARIRQLLFRYLLAGLTVSMAVTIGTAPLLLYYFNRLSLIGPAANLLIEGLICFWSLPLGFLASPLIFIAPPAADLLLHLGGYGLTLSLRLAAFFNELPFSTLWLPTPPPVLIVLYYAAILLFLWSLSALRGADARPLVAKTAMAGGGALWLVTLFFIFMPPAELFKHSIPASEITFLDVGQGSSTFLQLPTGKRLLIDGGGSESPRFNVGEDIISRFLWQRGIKRLDMIMITHSDADHYNGIPFLLQRFRPQTLWINDFSGHDQNWEKLLELARRLHITVKIPQSGETLIRAGNAGIVSLGNPSEPYGKAVNDSSLILRFGEDTDHDFSCLFAGDIGHKAEAQLVKEKIPLQSTFLLSPHHGSSTSNSETFLQAVNPRAMIVSAGRHRSDKFPTPEVRQRCASLGIPMLITAEHGAITITDKEITWHDTDKGW